MSCYCDYDERECFLRGHYLCTPDMFAEYRELPPGPMFIPLPNQVPWPPYRNIVHWMDIHVPTGYVWQPATNWTGAGWVRPHGEGR